MSTATLELIPQPQAEAGAGPHEEGSAPTLENLVLAACEDLALRGRAACPVCDGWIEPAGCPGCGSELS